MNNFITKIEGHGKLNISFASGKAKLEIDEGERLFEALLLGRPYHDAPFITSRICGVCPVAHTLASIKGLENALKIKPSETTINLRRMIMAGQIIQSHALHLFFLALADYLPGIDSALDLAKKNPVLFKIAVNLKKIGDDITTIIGGRNVHPINLVVGGFSKLPDKNKIKDAVEEAKNLIPSIQKVIRIFSKFSYPDYFKETEYLCLKNAKNYEIYEGDVLSSTGKMFKTDNYKKEIKEEIKPYSTAKFGKRTSLGFMVGAIARISNLQDNLNYLAKKELIKTKIIYPTYNSFYNNLAQAVEILHFLEEITKLGKIILKDKDYESALAKPIKIKSESGVGAVEAPRGTLYHYYELDKNGLIKNCDIITPTVQNLSNIEAEAKVILTNGLSKNRSTKKIAKELEMLVRSYDPCITCSVH